MLRVNQLEQRKLSNYAEIIYACLFKRDGLSLSEIQAELNLSVRIVKYHLSKLVKADLVYKKPDLHDMRSSKYFIRSFK